MKKLLFLLLLATGCEVNVQYRKNECVRVFMHEPGLYSVLDKDLKSVSFRDTQWLDFDDGDGRRQHVSLIADVPKDKSMWYEGEYQKDSRGSDWRWVKIHIHNVEDVNGADWNTPGKHSKHVTTKPVE
jgi:hypothetical protein